MTQKSEVFHWIVSKQSSLSHALIFIWNAMGKIREKSKLFEVINFRHDFLIVWITSRSPWIRTTLLEYKYKDHAKAFVQTYVLHVLGCFCKYNLLHYFVKFIYLLIIRKIESTTRIQIVLLDSITHLAQLHWAKCRTGTTKQKIFRLVLNQKGSKIQLELYLRVIINAMFYL
jgi:hypothetical protein